MLHCNTTYSVLRMIINTVAALQHRGSGENSVVKYCCSYIASKKRENELYRPKININKINMLQNSQFCSAEPLMPYDYGVPLMIHKSTLYIPILGMIVPKMSMIVPIISMMY